MFKVALLASASIFAFATSSNASDLPSKKAPVAVVPTHAAAGNWAGCYVGLNGGFASQSTSTEFSDGKANFDEGSNTGSGGSVGGQIGCDYQSGNVVFGVQGLVDWTNLSGHNDYADNEGGMLTTDARWFATLTGRLGYAIQPETLLYVKGGAAWINNRYSDENNLGNCCDYPKNGSPYTSTGEASETLTGWTLGAGIEHKFTANWSAFAEYDYMDFGLNSIELTDENSATWTNKYTNHVHVGLLGINYSF